MKIPTIDLIVFDCGEYPAPASLVAAYKHMPKRFVSVGGCPCCGDGAYTSSYPVCPEFDRWLAHENARCTEAHMTGAPFQPKDYPLE